MPVEEKRSIANNRVDIFMIIVTRNSDRKSPSVNARIHVTNSSNLFRIIGAPLSFFKRNFLISPLNPLLHTMHPATIGRDDEYPRRKRTERANNHGTSPENNDADNGQRDFSPREKQSHSYYEKPLPENKSRRQESPARAFRAGNNQIDGELSQLKPP